MQASIATAVMGSVAHVRAGRFEIERLLGQGGMGSVFLAHDPELDRRVAIKVLKGDDPGAAARLQREAVALAKLQHPNVVAVHEVGVSDDEVFVAMEYVEGVDLATWLTQHPLGEPGRTREALGLLLQAADGLVAAHEAGLVHRDFKPSNVLVGDDGRVRVADFGLVRTGFEFERTLPAHASSGDPRLTQTGAVVGTPLYLPPEQRDGQLTDARSDQFSFCVSAWHVLFGRLPWPGTPQPEVPPSEPPDAPGWLLDVLKRGLKLDPAQRYRSMRDLVSALADDPTRRRRRIVAAVGVLTVLGVGAGGYGYYRDTLCEGGRIDAVWSAERRGAIETALLAADRNDGADVVARTLPHLDELAAEWGSTYRQVCEAGRLTGTISPSEYGRAMSCLQMRRAELDAAADVLADGHASPVAAAIDVAYTLGRPQSCARFDQLGEVLELPVDPHEAQTVLELYEKVYFARLLVRAGATRAAAAHTEAIRDELSDVDHGALQLRLIELRAKVAAELKHGDEAIALHDEGYWEALRAGDDAMAARFAMWVARDRQYRSDIDTARWMIRTARVLARRAELGDAGRSHVASIAAAILMREGHFPEAKEELEEALRFSASAWGEGKPQSIPLLGRMSSLLTQMDDFEGALDWAERGVTLAESAYGPFSLTYAEALSDSIRPLKAAGRTEEALERARTMLQIFERVYPPDHWNIGAAHSVIANVTEDPEEELEHFRLAREIGRRSEGEDHTDVLFMGGQIGRMLARLGRYDEAEAELTTTVEALERVVGPDHQRTGFVLALLMHTHLVQGKMDEAREEHRRALAIGVASHGEESSWIDDLKAIEARFLMLDGHLGEALALLEERRAVAQRRESGKPLHTRITATRAEVLARMGRREEADSAFADALARMPADDPAHEFRARRALNLVELGRPTEARAVVEEGLRLHGDGLPHLGALLHYALAVALQPDDKAKALEHARIAAADVRDAPWVDRVKALVAALGGP